MHWHAPLTLALLLISTISSAAERLMGFNTLFDSLRNGDSVRIVAEYAKMDLFLDGEKVTSPNAIGGMVIGSWEHFGKGVVRNEQAYIATSETTLIAHPSHGHVFNYVRFRIYEDGKVEVTARYLKPVTYEVVMDETFRGAIAVSSDSGASGGVSFFRLP